MAGIVALNWSGSLFLSTLENYIPNDMVRTKAAISGTKFVISLPIRFVEWTFNRIFGFAENAVVGSQLPTDITEAYRLNVGPKLKNISKLNKPVIDCLVNKLKKL